MKILFLRLGEAHGKCVHMSYIEPLGPLRVNLPTVPNQTAKSLIGALIRKEAAHDLQQICRGE